MSFEYISKIRHKQISTEFTYKKDLDGTERLLGYFLEDELAGFIAYRSHKKELFILYIEVKEKYKRRHIAEFLLKTILVAYSDYTVSAAIGSYEGSALFKGLIQKGIVPKDIEMVGDIDAYICGEGEITETEDGP